MYRFITAAAAALLLTGTLVFAQETSEPAEENPVVQVSHGKLEPPELNVPAGTTVVFRNVVEMPGGHSIVAADDSFASPSLDKEGEWSHTFAEPGTYTYTIKEHPSAQGKIVVE